jgi:hypothetical protein
MKLFSAFAAAELLERDRQTIARALRNTPPDGKEKNQPRWKLSTIIAAMERHTRANDVGRSGITSARGPDRLGVVADELEQLHEELDAALELIRTLPTMDAKQPHSRAGMRLLERIDALYNEANEILAAEDSTSLSPYVTPQIVGTLFRLLLAAAYGPKADIDGQRIFSDDQIVQFGLVA